MIVTFRHRGLRRFFESSNKRAIRSDHAKRLRLQLAALESATTIGDLDIPGFRLHPLKGTKPKRWSITVNANWRLTFEFKEGEVRQLDYEDYH